MARSEGIATHIIDRHSFYETEEILDVLAQHKTNWIALAGFLWLIPPYLIQAFPERMLNIHPALLPAYGGKGMYGAKVHEAVVNNGEWRSGITIHLVNEAYDEGAVLAQAQCLLSTRDTPDSLAQKIHQLEYAHFPVEVEKYILNRQANSRL